MSEKKRRERVREGKGREGEPSAYGNGQDGYDSKDSSQDC